MLEKLPFPLHLDMPLVLPQPLLLVDQKQPTVSILMDQPGLLLLLVVGLDMDPNEGMLPPLPMLALAPATDASAR